MATTTIAKQPRLDASTGVTCITCRLVFASTELQRTHYQTEWHRYNIKRQVAELPPISQKQFESKLKLFAEQTNASSGNKETENAYCNACSKLFKSKNAFDNHLNSKKHKSNEITLAANGGVKPERPKPSPAAVVFDEHNRLGSKAEDLPKPDPMEVDDDSDDDSGSWHTVDSDEEEDFDYDETKAISSTSCLFCPVASSSIEGNLEHMFTHGFFVPDAEYCVDVPGLLSYLGMKVGCGNICVLCNKRSRNFASLSSVQKHMRAKQHCRFSIEDEDVVEYLDFYDYGSLLVDSDGNDDDVIINEGYSLVLPSGARIGHRSLLRYYKQYLRDPQDSIGQQQARRAISAGVLGKCRALAWTGATTPSMAVQRARDVRFMKRIAARQWMHVGVKSNKLFKTRGRNDQQ